MSNGSELKSTAASILRAAGLKPCPRWWLTQEQLELVEYMARQNENQVVAVRNHIRMQRQTQIPKKTQIDLAWEQQKKT